MKILEVAELKNKILEDLKERVTAIVKKKKAPPCLAIILVGNNPASESYVRTKKKMCDTIGIRSLDFHLPDSTKEEDIISIIDKLNSDDSVNGILVQLPLPKGINKDNVIDAISPKKDADGICTHNLGLTLADKDDVFACTPKGIMRILEYNNISLDGKNVAIINRSLIVGRPLMAKLISTKYNATVFSCNSHTKNLDTILSLSDIIISAVGSPNFINSSTKLKKGAVIIDVSINRVEDKTKEKGYRVCGDVDEKSLESWPVSITKVPGGVGVMTVVMLMENTVALAEKTIL